MTIFNVSSTTELNAALANAVGGDTIELAAGDYGNLRISSSNGQFTSNVTITSADPGSPASFSGLNVNGASNITFDNVVFDYTYTAGDAAWLQPFGIYSSAGISITNSLFDGDVPTGVSSIDDGVGTVNGLYVRSSSDITLEGNEIRTFKTGVTFLQSSDINVINNDVHSIRSDGMDFVEVQNALIEGNYFHDFLGAQGSSDHRDMIQFWTAGTDSPSTDIIIRDNVFDVGENGDWSQSIFMGNEAVAGGAGTGMYYQNVLIENNTIYNSHLQAIAVFGVNGLTVQNNSVIQAEGRLGLEDGAVSVPVINISSNSTDVQILSNITERVLGYNGQSDWVLQGNAFIQNTSPTSPGYYGDVFVTSSMEPVNGAHAFLASPGGMIDTLGAGSDLVLLGASTGEPTPPVDDQPDPVPDPDPELTPELEPAPPPVYVTAPEPTPEPDPVPELEPEPTPEPEPTHGSEPEPDPEPQPAHGMTIEAEPEPDPSNDMVPHPTTDPAPLFEAEPEPAHGTATEPTPAPMSQPVQSPVLDDFILDANDLNNAQLRGDASIVQTADGPGIRLDGDNDIAKVGRLGQFDGAEQLMFSVDFASMNPKEVEQRLIWNPDDIGLSVVGDSLKLYISLDGGNGRDSLETINIDGLGINDGAMHTAMVISDSISDQLQVIVDDEVVFDQAMDVAAFGRSSWWLGSHRHDFEGDIGDFRIEEGATFVEPAIEFFPDDASLIA